MADFKFIEELGLSITFNLIALQRTTQRYSMLLYQHEGILKAEDKKIGNALSVSLQLNDFCVKAKEKNVDLALTPEYSCPWQIINNIVSDSQKWPNIGKLWVIGCESITKEEIIKFKSDFNKNDSIVFYDESVHGSNKNFLDPLVYLFQVQKDSINKLFILIQFKTRHMGVWGRGDIERDNIIQGNEIYILRNTPQSIHFMSLICSDALNFSSDLDQAKKDRIEWDDKPYLIFNPQLNPDPSHPDFIAFRKFVFLSNDKEVISLNWQLNSKIGTAKMLRYEWSRSGLYLKSSEINYSDLPRIVSNHEKGLYYFNNKKNKHSFLLNSSPHGFLIENLPVKISNAQPVQIRRDGPKMIEAMMWKNQSNSLIKMNPVSDDHIDYLTSTGCQNKFLLDSSKCILEKERLVCLSIGKVTSNFGTTWSNIDNVDSIAMDENTEINGRITVAQDSSVSSIDIKTKFIDSVNELKTILDSKISFPDNISDLKNEDIILSYYTDSHSDKYRYNVTSTNGDKKNVTIAYLNSPPLWLIGQTYTNLRNLFDNDNKNKERVVLFYKMGDVIKAEYDKSAASITGTNDYDDNSILKENDE